LEPDHHQTAAESTGERENSDVLILGLILVVAAVAVTVAVVQTGGDPVQVHAIWFSVHTNGAVLFVAGAASLLLLVLGLWVLRVGLRRTRRRRREMKELRQRAFEATPATTPGSSRPAPHPPAPPPPRHGPDADDHFDTTPRD
jgi:membrane protein implicated in regulation of membrane protease activity